jgi:DNA-binding transcriptional MerR regulator
MVQGLQNTKRQTRNISHTMHNLTIKQASEITGIPPYTLRFWEKEFEGILIPSRTNGGQRRYNEEHISIIEDIKRLKKQGIYLSRIKEKLSNKENHSNRERIDLLAQRVGKIVKHEVYDFLKGEDR